jgi:hypothetical protein
MLSSRSAGEVAVQRFSKRVTGGWGAAGMAEESSFAAGVRAREGAKTASDGHSQELRYSAGEAAGADAALLCGQWRGRTAGDSWGGWRASRAAPDGGAHARCGRSGDAARPVCTAVGQLRYAWAVRTIHGRTQHGVAAHPSLSESKSKSEENQCLRSPPRPPPDLSARACTARPAGTRGLRIRFGGHGIRVGRFPQ